MLSLSQFFEGIIQGKYKHIYIPRTVLAHEDEVQTWQNCPEKPHWHAQLPSLPQLPLPRQVVELSHEVQGCALHLWVVEGRMPGHMVASTDFPVWS